MSVYDSASKSNKEVTRDYPYSSYIKTPRDLGASPDGNLTALGNDIGALVAYTQVLVSGNSKGQTVRHLGNKYFLDTGGTCTTPEGESKKRYIYINNVPSGSIPIISSAMGVNMSEFRGLVPGVLESSSYLNPMALLKAFSANNICQEITMPTRDIENRDSMESRYVNQDDIETYDPCWFNSRVNPITKKRCVEAMENKLPPDILLHTYFLGIGILGLYTMYRLMNKN
mgnify:CR=1 FL=1